MKKLERKRLLRANFLQVNGWRKLQSLHLLAYSHTFATVEFRKSEILTMFCFLQIAHGCRIQREADTRTEVCKGRGER